MNNHFKKYLKYKKKYLNFTGGAEDSSPDYSKSYQDYFNQALAPEYDTLKDQLHTKIYDTLINYYFDETNKVPTVKKFILYILNPDNPEFLENDNNKTEQSIQTIKAYKNLSDCVKPDNIKLLETFIETHIPDIHNIFIDYIYKLLLSNYGVWYEIFNMMLFLKLPKQCDEFYITPNIKKGCHFVMGTVMRRLGINIFHDYMTQLYFQSIYNSMKTSCMYCTIQKDDLKYLDSCFVY